MSIAVVLLCVAVLVLGVVSQKPYGWIATGLAVLALILHVAHWPKL